MIAKPVPVHLGQQPVDQGRDGGLGKILARDNRPGEEDRGINRGELALPRARTAVHFHEMIEEAALSRCPRGQKLKHQTHLPHRLSTADPAALDGNDPGRQRKAGGRDARLALARGAVGPSTVPHESGDRVGLFDKKLESGPLHLLQQCMVGR
jgi:hypothetical protein